MHIRIGYDIALRLPMPTAAREERKRLREPEIQLDGIFGGLGLQRLEGNIIAALER